MDASPKRLGKEGNGRLYRVFESGFFKKNKIKRKENG